MTETAVPRQKRVWPLFLVAGLSFVPFAGIFFGGAGATWGLVSSRPRAMWAAWIAMAGALLNFAVVIVIAMSSIGRPDAAVDARFTQQELLKVVVAIDDYHAREQAYPPSLPILTQHLMLRRLVPTVDMSGSGFHLPRDYHYAVAPDGESYDLVATGPDNVIGTPDDIRPILPDSLKLRSGFRASSPGNHP